MTRAPWACPLASGVRCQAVVGVTGTIAAMQVSAACSDGSQIVGVPDRSGWRWRVYVMRDNSLPLEEREIVASWYQGRFTARRRPRLRSEAGIVAILIESLRSGSDWRVYGRGSDRRRRGH